MLEFISPKREDHAQLYMVLLHHWPFVLLRSQEAVRHHHQLSDQLEAPGMVGPGGVQAWCPLKVTCILAVLCSAKLPQLHSLIHSLT